MQRFSLGFKSGDWLSHSRTLMRCPVCVVMCPEKLFVLKYALDHCCTKTSNVFLISLLTELQRYLSNISQYFWELIVAFITWSSPMLDEKKNSRYHHAAFFVLQKPAYSYSPNEFVRVRMSIVPFQKFQKTQKKWDKTINFFTFSQRFPISKLFREHQKCN